VQAEAMVNARATFALVALLGVSTASVVQFCQKTTCTYTDIGDGLFRTKIMTNNEENFKCGKGEGLTCDCYCADHFTCTLDHHLGDGEVKSYHHCEAVATPFPTPFPTPSPTPFPTPSPTPPPTHGEAFKVGDVIGLYNAEFSAFLGLDSRDLTTTAVSKSKDQLAAEYQNENAFAYFRVENQEGAFALKNIHSNAYLSVVAGGAMNGVMSRSAATKFVYHQVDQYFGLSARFASGDAYVMYDGTTFTGSLRSGFSFSPSANPWLSFEAVKVSYPFTLGEDFLTTAKAAYNIPNNKKVFFVESTLGKYEISKDFKDDACRAFYPNAQVCTWGDMSTVQGSGGASVCRCSYLRDGVSQFPMQPYTSASGTPCGPLAGGVNSCGYGRAKADVCCVVAP